LGRRGLRGAGEDAVAGSPDRALLPRRRAHARRHLPRAADRERAAVRHRHVTLSDADTDRGGPQRIAGVRRCRTGAAAGRRMQELE
jgi:hypothetical protein